MKTLKRFFMCLLLVIVTCFQSHNLLEAASDLIVSSTVTLSGSAKQYNRIIIRSGGKLSINSSNITIEANYLQMDSGGELTYHSNQNNTQITVAFKIYGEAVISGKINFDGKDGTKGSNGSGSSNNGKTGGTGISGKNLTLHINNSFTLNGVITAKGGQGGEGGKGHRDDDLISNPIGKGGNGGTGGKGGNINIKAAEIVVNSKGQIVAEGGKGGKGGKGGSAGTWGSGERGGDGGTGGQGGTVILNVQAGSFGNKGTVSVNGGAGGSGGSGGSGGLFGSSGKSGSSGKKGLAGNIDITSGYFDNTGKITATGRTSYAPVIKIGYRGNSGTISPSPTWLTDEKKPIPDGSFTINLEDSGTDQEGNLYTNEHAPLLSWTAFRDVEEYRDGDLIPPSGLKQYEVIITKNGQRIDIKGDSAIPNVVYSTEVQLKRASSSILEDGMYEVRIKGSDYANNQSDVYPSTPAKFIIDTQPPTAPVLLKETEVTETRATINWEPSIDNNMIDCYELQVLMETEDGGIESLTEMKELGQTLTFYPLHELIKVNSTENIIFSPNQKLLYQLRAKDIAGNYSTWSRKSVVTAPTTTAIIAVDSGWDYHVHKRFIILNVKSVGDQAEKYRYVREKKVTENGQTEYATEFISEWFSISSLAESIFRIKDIGDQVEVEISDDENLLLNGSGISSAIAPHNEYRCFIETKNASSEEYDWNTQKSSPCALAIKNTPPLEQGVISPAHGCRLNKEEVELKIKPFIDPDGDDLSYLFYVGYDNNNDGIYSEEEYVEVGQVKDKGMPEIAVTTELLQEGEYRWYVKVSDGYMTEPIQSQVYNFEKDVTPPSISFGIYDALGIHEIEATNKKKIKISDISLCQDTVEIRILEGDKLLHKDSIRPFDDIEITISDGEGSKAITFEATDEAGNSASQTKNIIYDLTSPAAPTNLRIRGGRNQLFINWDSAQDNGAPENSSGVKGYLFTYKSVETDEEVQEVFIEQSAMPSYTIINLGNNQQRQISVRTVDRAGNYSVHMLTGVGCSLAEKGVINSITFQPAPAYTEYSAILQLQQVEADQYTIRRWTIELDENGEENLVNQIDTDWRNITDSPYIDENILPHTKYYYSIITRNGQGEVESNSDLIKYEFTVANQEPSIPVIKDLVYTRFIPVVLRTEQATDTDGDTLQYFFTLKDGSGEILIDNAPANNPDDPDGLSYIIQQELINEENNGEDFYWQVGVTDGYMFDEQQDPLYIYSQEGRVTIDTIAPEIMVSPEDLTEYLSELELDITVIDQISGVEQVVYHWNQEDVSPQDRESIVLELGGVQEYQFKITDVPTGRNNLYLTASDTAGNENIKTFVCKLDLTPPLISNLTVTGKEISGRLYTTNSSSITAEWEIKEDYTDIDYYRYAVITPAEVDRMESLPAERFDIVDEYFPRIREKFAQVAANHVLVENNTYHFAVEAVNTVGLSSGIQVSPGVTIDSKPPQIGEIDFGNNIIIYNDKYYLSNFTGLSVDVDINDHGGSGIKEVKYALTEEMSEQTKKTWYDSIEDLKTGQTTIDGTVYALIVKATDYLNQERIRSSDSIIIDKTAPVVEELVAGSRLVITGPEHVYEIRTGSHIPISLRIEDQIELESIEYAIGTDLGKNDITAAIYPESNGWMPLDSLEHRQQFTVGEELPDGIYYINLQVKNVAGLVTAASSNPVKIDSSLSERPVVWDDGEYTTNNNELHFSWTFNNAVQAVQAYEYRIHEVAQGEKTDLTGKHRITPEKQGDIYSYTVTGLSLADGNEYYIELRAVYQDGTTSLEQTTDGIIVDTTFPEEIYIKDGSYSTSDCIFLRWGAKDRESGISSYQIKIGTNPGGAEITGDWIALDQTGQGRLENLPFIHADNDVYYTTLKVTNGAGLTREVSSDGFRIDDTPPPIPTVLDQGRYTSDEPIHLDFTWKWSEVDPESENSHYEIALLTARQVDALTEWTNLGKQTEVTFTEGLVEGIWYYLAVKVVNGAGLSTIGMSDGILIDTSAPTPPQISDEADYLQIDSSGYTALKAVFTASDDESDIDFYEYSLGTLEQPDALISGRKVETEQIITENFPLLPGEIYYFTVRAVNKAGLVSMESRSDGVMIINGYPEITEVNDFGDYTTFNDQIIVTWECLHTGYAPIDYYQVELSTDGQTWIKAKDVMEKQVNIVPSDLDWTNFKDGTTYFVSIRGVNKAGVITPAGKAGISDGIKVDNSPPGISDLRIIHTDQYTTSRFKIHLQATDSHSGITAYTYAVGKTRGGTEMTGGWVLRETSTLNFEEDLELKLEHNKRYYVTFQARNGTGLWSKLISDEGIIADLTPPEVVDFSGDDYLNSTGKVQFWWKATDPETGVTGYRYEIVENRDNPDLSNAPIYETTEEEVSTEVSVPENLIIEETQYYLALQVRNRLGVWSLISYKEFTVDTLCPIITISNPQDEIVTNDGKADLFWNVTEQAEVEYGLYRILTDAQEEYVSGGVLTVDNPLIQQTYGFEEDEHAPATYYLKLIATDLAGNRGTPVLQYIRINAKPTVNIGLNRTIYKGKELQISAAVNDPDGQVVAYSWDFGDGATSTEAVPVHSYSELGEYIVTLFCTDNNGGVGTDTIRVTVTNTFSGKLAMDEVWSGKIKLSDTVIVPVGVKLLIKPGTVIESPAEKGLIIDGSFVVEGMTGQEVLFTIDPNYAQQMKWKGIRINSGFEEVVMNYAQIKRAERGVTVIQRNIDLNGLQLTENFVGIHLYNTSPSIRNCIITDNELYGIKEDRDCEPLLINNIFSNNYVGDYYDSVLTILSPQELQELNG